MRDPRPGLPWSIRRLTIRGRYAEWMSSPEWFQRRERWLVDWQAAHNGQDPTCAICDARWTLDHGDLHHRSYERVGRESHDDLSPLCRDCHDQLHALLERNPAWRRVPRPQATDLLCHYLRHLNTRRTLADDRT